MLKQILTAAALTVGLAAVHAQSLSSRSLTAPATRDVGFIAQSFVLTPAGHSVGNTEFSVAPLTMSNQGFGTRKLAVRLPGAPVTVPSPMGLPALAPQSDIGREGLRWVAGEFAPFKANATAWLRSRGLSHAYYTFSQEVMVTTPLGPRKKAVSFMATLLSNGSATYGAPKLVDPEPTLLEVLYTPLATVKGLPPSWVFPNAGTLRWRLLSKRYVELTGWTTLNVNGAYDSPEEGDPLQRVPCLVDQRHAGCGGADTSIKDLMDQQGATFGLVSYIRRMEPVYIDSGSDTVPATPKMTMSVDQRVWNCSKLTHDGSFGMELYQTADQFAVSQGEPAYGFQKVAEFGNRAISPTTPYTVSATRSELAGSAPDQVILAPTQDGETPADKYWLRTDAARMAGVISVSPLVVDQTSSQMANIVSAADVAVTAAALGGGVTQYDIGTVGDNYWGGSYTPYDRSVTFNLPDPEAVREFTLSEIGYDDYIMVSLNGTVVYAGPYGGNTLQVSAPANFESCITVSGGFQCGNIVCDLPPKWWDGDNECRTATSPTVYPQCDFGWDSGSVESARGSWTCSTTTCPAGTVQFVAGARNFGNGCGHLELRQQWRFSPDLNLRPYLRAGANQLFIRTVVGGRGEMWLRLRVRGCALD